MLAYFAYFFIDILRALPGLFPRFALAWILTFTILVLCFGAVKRRMRHEVTTVDGHIRHWAKGLRYRNREDKETERVWLSWFFRFWTNFASAPSLSTFSLIIPFWVLYRDSGFKVPDKPIEIYNVAGWLLPGLCFAGSMLMSFIMKKVFKRVRPPREHKAFGYKMKDASFPSGHSLTSFCFWLMFTLVLVQSTVISLPVIILLAVIAVTIIILTGLSRIYLGVHFPSDVGGGWVIGAAWCIACYLALQPILLDVLRRLV